MSYGYECHFNLDDCLKKLGLNEKGRVQQVVDNEVIQVCDPYVPFDTGQLKNSAYIENGGGEIVYPGPYARRLYYGEENWNWSNGGVQEGGLRGPYWADRVMRDGGTEQVEDAARKAVKG